MGNDTPLDVSIGALIGTIYRRISHQLMQRLKPFDISTEQWSVLFRIYQAEGLNQKEIAKRAVKDQPTTARIIDLLDKKGWAKRVMSEVDRRAFLLYITDDGRNLIEKTLPIEQATVQEVLQGITPDQLEQFRMIIQQMHLNINEMETQGEIE